MTAKWYLAYYVYGFRDYHIARISNMVKQNDLGAIIPCLHTERLRQGQTGQFYLFIGFNSDSKGEIPIDIQQLLDTIYLVPPAGNFVFEEIKSMVSAGIDTQHYTRKIVYHPPAIIPAEDPLDLSDLEALTDKQPTKESILALNRLIYWLSATGSGTWPTFKRVTDTLTTDTVGLDARQIFRYLRLLGHTEYASKRGLSWSVCPPALVQMGNSDRYFLAGQRTPQLIKMLSELILVEELLQPTGQAPDLVQLEIVSPDAAQNLVSNEKIRAICPLRWAGPASMRLATILPDLAEYRATLPPVTGFAESNFSFRRWEGQRFVERHFQQKTGMYQLTPRDPKSLLPKQNLFFDAEQNCWRTGPWYDLCYLAQQLNGEICRVIYNRSQQRLSIPANYRWPDLYERALVLASGFLPLPAPDKSWFYFGEVTPDLAQILSQKLNAVLEETT